MEMVGVREKGSRTPMPAAGGCCADDVHNSWTTLGMESFEEKK
jgi:hypothetical protein